MTGFRRGVRLGIDVGKARVGVSRCDPDGMLAVPVETVPRSDTSIERLSELAREWEPLEFELTAAGMCGNSWLYDVEVLLRDAWVRLSRGTRTRVGRHREWHSEHRAILASMRSRNARQAQRLVMAHVSLERFEEDLSRPRKR